jgi:ligand-binding sensor protein
MIGQGLVNQQALNRIRQHFSEILKVIEDLIQTDKEILDILRRVPPRG